MNNWGMTASSAASGPAAIAAVQSAAIAGSPIRLILLDVMMPGMDGFDTIRQLQQFSDFEDITVIMLSSAGRSEDKRRAAELGVARCLTKPVTQSQLFNAIAQSLGTAIAETSSYEAIEDRPAHFTPRRVLLAEDGVVNQKVAVELLTRRGHDVILATNGQEALKRLDEHNFDLILMDIQMPILDGLAATTAIRQREQGTGRHIPIVAMTAHAMAGDRERCLKAGMDAYVAKPFRPHELFRVVEEIGSSQPVAKDEPADGSDQSVISNLRQQPKPRTSEVSEFDREEALKRVGGSEEILVELVDLFRAECPNQLKEIREQHDAGDLPGLARAAHTLKGSVSIFAADPAFEAALRIERMAREGNAAEFDDAWNNLHREADRLLAAFDRVFPGSARS
jgi:CheY-like chemotaxis protein